MENITFLNKAGVTLSCRGIAKDTSPRYLGITPIVPALWSWLASYDLDLHVKAHRVFFSDLTC
jgi:hypothetical protein